MAMLPRITPAITCHGRCLLGRAELAQIVADSLLHFDTDRYRMGDFVVMPNHVHFLAAFASANAMKEQFGSWLHYTAFRINQRIGRVNRIGQKSRCVNVVNLIAKNSLQSFIYFITDI